MSKVLVRANVTLVPRLKEALVLLYVHNSLGNSVIARACIFCLVAKFIRVHRKAGAWRGWNISNGDSTDRSSHRFV